MLNREELIQIVKSGRNVVVNLTDAEVVSAKQEFRAIGRYATGTLYKIVAKDPVFGTVFFSSFSHKLGELARGTKVSLKVTVTGVGDASDRYPDPILFARPDTRKRDSVAIAKPIVFEPDLTVNV